MKKWQTDYLYESLAGASRLWRTFADPPCSLLKNQIRRNHVFRYKPHSQMVTKESQKTHALSMSHSVLDVV